MTRALYALHLLFAIAIIGPLIQAATTAGRGVRTDDRAATTSAARTATIYAYASLLVIVLGFGLLGAEHNSHADGTPPAIGQAWVWLSLLAWAASVALVLVLVVPTLREATRRIDTGETARALLGRVSAAGGVAGLLLVGIVFLMVYQPGR